MTMISPKYQNDLFIIFFHRIQPIYRYETVIFLPSLLVLTFVKIFNYLGRESWSQYLCTFQVNCPAMFSFYLLADKVIVTFIVCGDSRSRVFVCWFMGFFCCFIIVFVFDSPYACDYEDDCSRSNQSVLSLQLQKAE